MKIISLELSQLVPENTPKNNRPLPSYMKEGIYIIEILMKFLYFIEIL